MCLKDAGCDYLQERGRFFFFFLTHTQHLADIGLYVHVLEVLVGVSVKQTKSRVEANGHPDTIADPGQLPHLTLFARMGVKRLLLKQDRLKRRCDNCFE